MKDDLISILIPCFNAEQFLVDCLEALINQSYQNIEVIIVNDGSTDNSENIIDSYVTKFKDKRKKLIKLNQKNQGQAVAINNALKIANGDYLMWQDADDFYEKDAVKMLHDYLLKNEKFDFVRGNVAYRSEKNIKKIISIGKSKFPKKTNIFDLYLFEKDSYCFPGIFMVRALFFDKCVKNRCIYTSRAGQNWQLILPLAYNGKCGYLDKVVYNYRIVDNSHFHVVKSKKELLLRCDKHEDLLIHVIKDINQMPRIIKKNYIFRIKLKYKIKKLKIVIKSLFR